MIQVYKYDNDYIFETPVIINEIGTDEAVNLPKNCTTIAPPDGMFKPQFHPELNEWWEAASEDYILSLEILKKNLLIWIYLNNKMHYLSPN